VEKIFKLGDRILWGGSGESGFIQRARERLEAEHKGGIGKFTKEASDVCSNIRKIVVSLGKSELENLATPRDERLKRTKFLFCGIAGDRPWIFEVIGDGTATRYEETPGFHATGSAAHFAYAAFGLLRHHGVNAHGERGGLVVAYRILESSVTLAAGGVGEPLQYWILSKSGVRQPSPDEVRNVKETVGLWSESEKDALGKALGGQ